MPRKTIHLSDQAAAIVGESDNNPAHRVATILTRFDGIIRECGPALALPEWEAICDTLNGVYLQADNAENDMARRVWEEIADSDRLDSLGTKWGIDAAELARRVQTMPYHEQVAIVEIATRFWQQPDQSESMTEILERCGARIKV